MSWALPRRREALWIKAGNKCHWCGCQTHMSYDGSDDMATIDHILPRYKGGDNSDGNLVSSCNHCNMRRNKEDMMGLPDGYLLGRLQRRRPKGRMRMPTNQRVVLTGDEKRQILDQHQAQHQQLPPVTERTLQLLREQRDQAHARIEELNIEIARLKRVIDDMDNEFRRLRSRFWPRFRRAVAEFLLRA